MCTPQVLCKVACADSKLQRQPVRITLAFSRCKRICVRPALKVQGMMEYFTPLALGEQAFAGNHQQGQKAKRWGERSRGTGGSGNLKTFRGWLSRPTAG
jgi:hypothetical protein